VSEWRHRVQDALGEINDVRCFGDVIADVGRRKRGGVCWRIFSVVPLAAHPIEGLQDFPRRRVELSADRFVDG